MLRLTNLIILSFILHLAFYKGLILVESKKSNTKDETVIELIETPSAKEKSQNFERAVVKNSTTLEPKELKQPAQFIAEKNQRFEKQTRAKDLGVFQNVENSNSSKGKSDQKSNSPKKQEQKPRLETEEDVPEFAKVMQMQLAQEQRAQRSTIPFDLPAGIQMGNATNLNADAHIYATFYNRVIDLFYVRWAQRLDSIWSRLSLIEKKQLAGNIWSTDVEIILDSTGLYQKGLLMRSSGYQPFDKAGVLAFKDAQFFPNPPRSKVEADGTIRLRYRISVHVGSGQ